MKQIYKIKALSFFVILFFVLNVFSLSFCFEKKKFSIKDDIAGKFFASINMTTGILSTMFPQPAQSKNQTPKTTEKDNKNFIKISEYISTANLIIAVLNLNMFFAVYKIKILENFSNTFKSYPLKIPLRMCIFLLLLMKMLFNVLPRSVSLSSLFCVKRACIVQL